MKKLQRLLLSRAYAASALGLLAVLMGLAGLVPDADAIAELGQRRPLVAAALARLRPAEVARSPVVGLLAAYVAAAVIASMATRISAHRAAARAPGPPRLERFAVRRVLRVAAGGDETERRVRAAAQRLGLRAGAELAGSSGGVGFWGSMAFHGGLLVILVGIVLSARLRFEGQLVLTEGFPLRLTPGIFMRASPPQAVGALADTRLSVSDVSASYTRGSQLTDVSGVITVERPGAAPVRRFASVNVPVDVGEFKLLISAYGYAPELFVADAAGVVQADGNVMLRLLPPGTEDAVPLEGGGVLKVRFYPDHVLQNGEDATRSLVPTNPVLAFRWYEGARLVAQGRLARGEEVRVDGRTVAFRDFSRWLDLAVARDPGAFWFALGSLVAAAGLAVRMLFHERTWRARLAACEGGTEVEISLSARYYPARLEERAARLAAAIEGSADA